MNVTANIEQQAQIIAKRELKNPFAPVNGKTPEVKLPELVDQVVLTTVNSSSFDKYVEEMENGKQGVVDNFVKTLENFVGDFVKGISAVTETKDVEETKATEETTPAETNNTTNTTTVKNNDNASKYIAEYNTELEKLYAQLDEVNNQKAELQSKAQEINENFAKEIENFKANGSDEYTFEDLINNRSRALNDVTKQEIALEYKRTSLELEISMILSNIEQLSEISAKIEDIEDPELKNEIIQKFKDIQDEKAKLFHQSNDIYEDFNTKLDETRNSDGTTDITKRRIITSECNKVLKNEIMPKEIELISKEYEAQEFMNQYISDDKQSSTISKEDAIRRCEIQYQLLSIQNELLDCAHESGNMFEVYKDKKSEAYKKYDDSEIKAELEQIENWYESTMAILKSKEDKLEQEQEKLLAELEQIEGKSVSTTFSSELEPTTTKTTSGTSTGSYTYDSEDKDDDRFELKLKDNVKENFFKKNNFSFLTGSKGKTEPKVKKGFEKIINNIGSSRTDLDGILDAFEDAGKRANFRNVKDVAGQLGVHINNSELRKALLEK
ncbi:hypothetical protein IJ818_05380 [bacterium]|nr:hypothetical protein [bacterium]